MHYSFEKNKFIELDFESGKTAVFGSDESISWETLKSRCDELTKIFTHLNIPKGHPVIIYGHQEANFVASMISLIKNDLVFVPIDVVYPIERLNKIQALTGSQVIINCSNNTFDHDFAIEIHHSFIYTLYKKPVFNDDNVFWFENDPLRYIIFTSGSTGEPKGVQISKRAVVSFSEWLAKDYGFKNSDVFMNQAPFSFDLSLYNFYTFLTVGGSLLLLDNEDIKEEETWSKLKKEQCSVWISTPSFAYICLRDEHFNEAHLNTLNKFIFIGEELPKLTVTKLQKKFPNASIVNSYGPTEATVATSCLEITPNILETHDQLPIGYPKRDSTIIFEEDNPTKDNPSEIIIVGDHVSIGYFKRPDLNQEKFYTYKGKPAFKTGDLGYKEGDLLFFNGRIDNQIKFNGYRIELGEINAVINGLAHISNSYTIALKRNSEVKAIVTFVTTEKNLENTKSYVLDSIKGKLPVYMIPKDIARIKAFPVNTNHKIDGKKLVEMYKKGEYIKG